MKFSSVAFIGAALSTFGSGAQAATNTYSISEPTAGAVVSIGQASVIQWNSTAASNAEVSFYLETKSSSDILYVIGDDIYNSGSIAWSPLGNISTGADYIIALVPKGSSDVYYSSEFTISNSTSSSTYYPTAGEVVDAGQTTIVTWDVKSGVSKVDIYLMKGSSTSDLTNVSTVATAITNGGSVGYIIPAGTSSGSDYVFGIFDTSDASNVIYSSKFTIENDSATSSSGSASSATSSGSGSAATSTGSSSSSGSSGTSGSSGSSSTTTSSSATSSSSSSSSKSFASITTAGNAYFELSAIAILLLALF